MGGRGFGGGDIRGASIQSHPWRAAGGGGQFEGVEGGEGEGEEVCLSGRGDAGAGG